MMRDVVEYKYSHRFTKKYQGATNIGFKFQGLVVTTVVWKRESSMMAAGTHANFLFARPPFYKLKSNTGALMIPHLPPLRTWGITHLSAKAFSV